MRTSGGSASGWISPSNSQVSRPGRNGLPGSWRRAAVGSWCRRGTSCPAVTGSRACRPGLHGRRRLLPCCRRPTCSRSTRPRRGRQPGPPTPAGSKRKLLVVRVKDCDQPGFLAGVVSFDLFGTTEAEAGDRLRAMVSLDRGKPTEKPVFPGRAVARFPGDVGPVVARWPSEAPVLQWPMADHSEARQAFARLLCEATPERALLVRGASETGKSHMSRQMTCECQALAWELWPDGSTSKGRPGWI